MLVLELSALFLSSFVLDAGMAMMDEQAGAGREIDGRRPCSIGHLFCFRRPSKMKSLRDNKTEGNELNIPRKF